MPRTNAARSWAAPVLWLFRKWRLHAETRINRIRIPAGQKTWSHLPSSLIALLHLLGLLDFFPGQIPGVLIEIDVVMVPFEFATLEINIVRPHRVLGRIQRLVVVAIGSHSVLIESP